jgi:hypothetical protein
MVQVLGGRGVMKKVPESLRRLNARQRMYSVKQAFGQKPDLYATRIWVSGRQSIFRLKLLAVIGQIIGMPRRDPTQLESVWHTQQMSIGQGN